MVPSSPQTTPYDLVPPLPRRICDEKWYLINWPNVRTPGRQQEGGAGGINFPAEKPALFEFQVAVSVNDERSRVFFSITI